MNIAILCESMDQSMRLMKQIKLIHREYSITPFVSSAELCKQLDCGVHFDLLFLDMDGQSENGLALVQYIAVTLPTALVVCITASSYLVLKCNEYVWRYILKPYNIEDIKQTLVKAQNLLAPQMLLIPTTSSKEHMVINIHNITYFEMFDKTGLVHTKDGGQRPFKTSLGSLEKSLSRNSFFRPHKSYLLNIEHIQYITEDTVCMCDGANLPLSRNRKNSLYKLLSDHSEIIFA